ncbi:MAG: hypothetical protein JNL48_15565 [Acidobacteria bacterium]|nr:hypothetical protein [Acidobacteriota bacterium]
MSDGPPGGGSASAPDPAPGLRWGARFSPQVLVLVATLAVASRPLKGAIITGVFWWWGDTYTQEEFVMDEAQVNEGFPFIDGHVEGTTDVTRITGMMVGEAVAPDGAPGEVFAPGRRVRIWRSPSAPDFGVEGASVNEFSVAARPELPGLGAFLGYVAATVVTLWTGFRATAWAGRRWARRWGQIDIRGTTRPL